MKAIWMMTAIALSFSSVACGGLGACKKGCKKIADCEEGDFAYVEDFDQDACETQCEEDQSDADDAGCKSEWNKLKKCGKKEFECDPDIPENPEDYENPCADEDKEYAECIEEE